MLRQSVKLEINVDTCGKMRELLVLRRAQHKQKRTERDPSPSPVSLHFLFTYLRAMKLSSPLKVCNASGGTAVAGARKLQTTKCCPSLSPLSLPISLSLSTSCRWTAVNYEQVGHNRNTCQTFLRPALLCVAAKVFSCGEINL